MRTSSPTAALRPGRLRSRVLAAAALLAGLVLCAVHVRTSGTRVGEATFVAVGVGASVVAWLGVRRSRERKALRLVALSVTLSTAGDLVYAVISATRNIAPDVSIADVAWIGGYVALAGFLLVLMRTGGGQRDPNGMIDSGVILVVVMTLQWELSFGEVASDPTLPLMTRIVFLSYPALDAVLLALVLRAFLSHQVRGRTAALVAAGVLLWLGADTFLTLVSPSVEVSGVVDLGWLLGSFMLAAAAWQPAAPDREPARPGRAAARAGTTRAALAMLPLLVPGVIEVASYLRGKDANPIGLFVASALLVGLGMARTVGAIRREDAARALLASQERYAMALAANSADAVVVLDADGVCLSDGTSLSALTGHPGFELRGTNTLLYEDGDSDLHEVRAAFDRALAAPGQTFDAEARVRHADGHMLWLSSRIVNLLHDPDIRGLVLNMHDITERKIAQEQLTHQAFHDALTGLANRALFADRVNHALRRVGRTQAGPAVLFLDLDGFKNVNDSLGHGPGDDLLREVGDRLRAVVRSGDTVARLGGDEFAILLDDTRRPAEEAVALAERVLAVVAAPLALGDSTVSVTASIGIAVGEEGDDAASLLRDADIAMYQAKSNGKAHAVRYQPAMRTAAVERLQIESDLLGALDRGELRLMYQPVVELETERVVGFEALLRWQHPTLGLVSPNRFVPIAEENGLIVPIGAWVLRQACAVAARWHRDYPQGSGVTMAVNLSACQLASPHIVRHVTEALEASGLDPQCLVLEMTESALVRDPSATAARLGQLHELGIHLAIDDFGTGYSSLSYLRQFPVDVLKIDRSFVSSISDPHQVPAIVRGMLDLARTLDLTVVAEGVEHEVQRDRLRDERCDFAQGFLFAHPLEVEDAEALVLHLGADQASAIAPS